jgi:colanic acid/amylovoran biosynthesis glycosyltransferase
VRVAYLVNQYPKVSHTFIRREIMALEARGVTVVRYALRRTTEPLCDARDREEAERTTVVLDVGARGLAAAMARVASTRPDVFARGAALASRIGYRSERGLAIHGAYLGEACVLLRWMERERIEHVHAHFGTNSAAVAMLAHALGGPSFSFHAHGPEEFDKPDAIALSEKIARARFVCGVSSFARSQLYRRARPEDWAKIHVVRCGIELERCEPRPLPSEPRLVSVGRLNEQKGQLLLIEALAQLARAGIAFHLTLVGDGEMRGVIEAAVRRHALEDRVRITGWASEAEVREHVLSARVLVLPSFAEGLPVVLMESLALERPAISTFVAGIPELIEPGRSGWLVPPGDVPALAAAICEALSTSSARLAEMGRVGREAVALRHDVRTSAALLHGLFERHASPRESTASARAA